MEITQWISTDNQNLNAESLTASSCSETSIKIQGPTEVADDEDATFTVTYTNFNKEAKGIEIGGFDGLTVGIEYVSIPPEKLAGGQFQFKAHNTDFFGSVDAEKIFSANLVSESSIFSYTIAESNPNAKVNFLGAGGWSDVPAQAVPVHDQNDQFWLNWFSTINGLANNDILTGTANPEIINGFSGNDKLSGLAGNDTLDGGAGNDTLDGGAGNDLLQGCTGNDIYIVGTGDIVTELANQGTDLVKSSISYTLPANVENLTLTGTTAINGTGNGLANTINGNSANNTLNGGTGNDLILGNGGVDKLLGGAGNDSLNGGAGNDTLTGGIGVDKFIYNTNTAFTTSAVGVDTITDFSIAQGDKIVLDKTTFPKITSVAGTGFSINSEFAKVNSDALAATSAADIVYNTATGGLFYNQNGTAAGFGTGAKFLTLTNKPVLTENQFVIQA
jgi:Ca2+-binding RTX toxin-like protein